MQVLITFPPTVLIALNLAFWGGGGMVTFWPFFRW
jgi:hypothetical protein